MADIDWFVKTMKRTFNKEVVRDEVSFESYDFYHEDIDDLLIPADHLKKLPNPLNLEAIMYIDEEGYEWILGVVEEDGTRRKLYEVWIKNGEQLAYEMYVDLFHQKQNRLTNKSRTVITSYSYIYRQILLLSRAKY
ncbi:hypothetical protein [Metabacillus sp. B2-18]|uniref:hypothetical protein n=1 Tax=Metabacillus sp. B2-18 TaxID=2897333 RepID=UPI001E451B8C|nr:hypothetical protein [Metabacillus sp. B2-18]UGB30578.1 hypothetical protein LPC09_23260 [Metabacillus sp. B2-18]